MSDADAVSYLPYIVIAMAAVFAVWTLRGKTIPDWLMGVLAPAMGLTFLILLSDSLSGIGFGLALIALGGVGWYRYFNKPKDKVDDPA